MSTDQDGQAQFSYTGASPGTDTDLVAATNAAGTISSIPDTGSIATASAGSRRT